MKSTNINKGSTPMAPDINAAARAERDKAIAVLDATLKAIDDRWSNMSSDDKSNALKQISDITKQKSEISSKFVENIFNSKAHQNIVKQISDATKKMDDEAKKIKDVASLLANGAKIIGYAAEVVGFFVLLA